MRLFFWAKAKYKSMKILIIAIVFSFSIFAIDTDKKVDEKSKSFTLNHALDGTGLSPKEFFDEFKKVTNHNFKKDKSDINFVMLNDFLLGLQDKKVNDVILSVKPKKDHNIVKFNMYLKDKKSKKIKKRELTMLFSQNTSLKNKVVTTVKFDFGALQTAGIKFAVGTGIYKIAVPLKEVITMSYDESSDQIHYKIYMKLVTPVHPDILNETFNETFEKVQKIAEEKVVPVIQDRLF